MTPRNVAKCPVMSATHIKKTEGPRNRRKATGESPWDVILHNEWETPLRRVILVLRKVIPGMGLKRAAKVAWEAHSTGRAVVKRCHKELAELYKERLQGEGLTISLERAS